MFIIYDEKARKVTVQGKRAEGFIPIIEFVCTTDRLNVTFEDHSFSLGLKDIIELDLQDDLPEKSISLDIKTNTTKIYMDHFEHSTFVEIHDPDLRNGKHIIKIKDGFFIRLNTIIINGENFFLELHQYIEGCKFYCK